MKPFFCVLLFALGVYSHNLINPLTELRSSLEGNENLFDEVSETATLQASPTVLTGATEMVTIQIKGVQNPSEKDVLALYAPGNADPKVSAPVKFLNAKHFTGDYVKSGNAVAKIQVVNSHSDVSFVLYRDVGGKWPHDDAKMHNLKMVAKSNTVTFKNSRIPNQGHIAFTANPGEIRVMWATDSLPSAQVVQYGVSPNSLTQELKGIVGGYSAKELCGTPAKDWGWKEPGKLYSAVLSGLTAGKVYYYRFGSNETGFSSQKFFKAPNVHATQVNFIAFGDLGKFTPDGTAEHWNAAHDSMYTVQHITARRNETDFVLHDGDIAYAVGYSAQWDEFMHQIEPAASVVPWMTTPGNHERDFPKSGSFFNGTDSGGECGVPYERRFLMPTPAPKKHWYSFNYGPVHIVAFSTEDDFLKGSEQYKFIVKDLAAVNRKKTPWVVVAGHRPMYANTAAATQLRGSIEPLFDKYNVDLAIWGHVHNYERTCPMYKSKCGEGKTTHVVLGMGGFGINNDLENKHDYIKKNINGQSGYGKIFADSNNLKLEFRSRKDEVLDSFALKK